MYRYNTYLTSGPEMLVAMCECTIRKLAFNRWGIPLLKSTLVSRVYYRQRCNYGNPLSSFTLQESLLMHIVLLEPIRHVHAVHLPTYMKKCPSFLRENSFKGPTFFSGTSWSTTNPSPTFIFILTDYGMF